MRNSLSPNQKRLVPCAPCRLGVSPRSTAMTSELELVQIGPDDVDPAVLTAGGVDVAELLARFVPVTRRQVDLAAFPTTGWRQVSRLEVGSGGAARFRFLAPHRQDPAGWALLAFMTWTDGWLQTGDPGPLFPRPGRPSRRQFLRLRWPPEPIVTQTGREPSLALSLQNLSDQPWVGTDAMETSACLLDPDGHRLPLSKRSHLATCQETALDRPQGQRDGHPNPRNARRFTAAGRQLRPGGGAHRPRTQIGRWCAADRPTPSLIPSPALAAAIRSTRTFELPL